MGGELLAQWVDDRAEGNAIFDDKYRNNFQTLNTKNDLGLFIEGRLNQKIKIKYRNGDKFKGEFKDGK